MILFVLSSSTLPFHIVELDFSCVCRYTSMDLNTVSHIISILKRRGNFMGSTRWSQAMQAIHMSRYRFSHFQDEPIIPDYAFVLSPFRRGRGFFLRSSPPIQTPHFQQYEPKTAGGSWA